MPIRNILLVLAMLVFAVSVSYFGQSASRATEDIPSERVTLEKVTTQTVSSGTAQNTTTAIPPEDIKPSNIAPKEVTPVPSRGDKATSTKAEPVAEPLPAPAQKKVPLLEGALVNILCTMNSASLHSTSGTGIFFDSRGLILTAAHVIEPILIADYTSAKGSSCVIRTGSPAALAYHAKLAYISPSWVRKNATTLIESSPTGTGENDFAVLAITEDASGNPVATVPYAVGISRAIPDTGNPVSIGSYGAEFMTSDQIRKTLFPTFDSRTIVERFTFTSDTVDLISLDGGVTAQQGSSGGGVLNADKELIGIITTSSSGDRLAERTLRAITPEHIRRSFREDMGKDFDSYFKAYSPAELIAGFDEEARQLAQIVVSAISSR